MEESALKQPDLIGRDNELGVLKKALGSANSGKGSTIFVSGEAGIGKTRLVSELIAEAEKKGTQVIRGWCLAESLEPLMPVKTALREAGLFHLISGNPPPLVVSAYLMNDAGLLIAKSEREELELDSHIFSSMLNAVGSFVKDALQMVDNVEMTGGLNILGYKEYKILIEERNGLYLASVTKGSLSEFLVNDMREVLSDVQKRYDDILADWDGDLDKVEGVESIVARLVRSGKYDGKFLVDDPKLRQENLFDNVLLGLQRLSNDNPILLFLDDLQWADPTVLNLLHYLARNIRKHGILILGTYRPEDIVQGFDGRTHQLETAMQNMNREDLLEKMELKRLGSEDTGKIIDSVLGKAALDQSFHEKIFKDTEGTPFFILEVVKLLVEDRSLAQNEEGVWELVTELDKLDVPSKVYDVVKRRLDRLMKEQREILECASVVGEEFRSDVVASTIGQNKIQLLKNLSEIEKSHKLIHSFEKKYVFDHAKIREVLYNGIMDELKQEYHRIVADTIAEIHKDNLDEVISDLAYHYYEAGDERAGKYLARVGDMATEEYANEEAIRLYENAIDIMGDEEKASNLEKLADVRALIGDYEKAIENFELARESTDDSETKARMLRKIADVYEKKGDYDKTLEVLAEAKTLVEEGTAEHGRILFGEGYPYQKKGDYNKAMPIFQEAIKISEKSGGDRKDIGNTLRAIGNIHWGKGEYEPALEHYEKSLAAMDEINEQYGIAAALNNIGIVHGNRGELDRALEFYGRCLKIIEKIGDKQGTATSLNNIGNVHNIKGELDRALEFYGRSLAIQEKIGDKRGIAYTLNNIGIVYYVRGELDRALEFHGRSLEIFENIGDKQGVAESLNSIGIVHLCNGNLDRALEFYGRSLEIFENIGDKQDIAMSLHNIGEIYRYKGELDKSLEFHGRSLKICSEIGNKWQSIHTRCGLAEVNLELGNVQDALENAENTVEISVEIGAKAEEGMSRRTLGMVYREMKDWTKAKEEFDKVNNILEEVGRKDELSKTLYEYALLFKAKGEPAKAKEHLTKALAEFERMGMKLWAEKCRKAIDEL